MKKFFILSMGVAILSGLGVNALAGAEGHGGGGFICPNRADNEFLDLYEAGLKGAVTPDGLNIVRKNTPVNDQIAEIMKKLDPQSALYEAVKEAYDRAVEIQRPSPGPLKFPEDAKNSYEKRLKGCQPVGVALYKENDPVEGEDHLDIDYDVLSQLPSTDQASLWIHEPIYKILRDSLHDPDSRRARKVVGHLFSDESPEQLAAALKKLVGWDISSQPNLRIGPKESWALDPSLLVNPKFQTIFVRMLQVDNSCGNLKSGGIQPGDVESTVWLEFNRLAPVMFKFDEIATKRKKTSLEKSLGLWAPWEPDTTGCKVTFLFYGQDNKLIYQTTPRGYAGGDLQGRGFEKQSSIVRLVGEN